MSSSLNVVLIVGSAPDALKIKDQDLSSFSSCVVINNAYLENLQDKLNNPSLLLIAKHC